MLYAGQDLGCALAETVFHDLDDDSAVPQEVLHSDLLTLRAGTLAVRRVVPLAAAERPRVRGASCSSPSTSERTAADERQACCRRRRPG